MFFFCKLWILTFIPEEIIIKYICYLILRWIDSSSGWLSDDLLSPVEWLSEMLYGSQQGEVTKWTANADSFIRLRRECGQFLMFWRYVTTFHRTKTKINRNAFLFPDLVCRHIKVEPTKTHGYVNIFDRREVHQNNSPIITKFSIIVVLLALLLSTKFPLVAKHFYEGCKNLNRVSEQSMILTLLHTVVKRAWL